jgi:enoyl-CoA hydratase
MIAALETAIGTVLKGGRHRAMAITGAGPSFSSGGDLKGYQDLFRDRPRFERFVASFSRVCNLIERSSIPTAAMVNGTCMAGGMELALSCDLITVAEEAKIGDGHLRFSQMPGSGAQRLVKAIGLQRARHWLLSGDLHTGAEAVEAGLAIGTVPLDGLREYTVAELARICRASPLALAQVKHLIITAQTKTLDEGLEIEARTAVEYATGSEDALEGITAFAERREPRFAGR